MGEYLVAYIDILGATNKIKSDAYYEFLSNANRLFTDTIGDCFIKNELIEYRVFSDNILFAIKKDVLLNNLYEDLFNKFLFFVAHYLDNALYSYGLLCRGAITMGDLCMSKKGIVLGKALVRAYEMENKIAIYPRVIVDNDILHNFNDYSLLKLCKDRLYMVDYFSIMDKSSHIKGQKIIKLYRLLAECWDDLKVRNKIIWLMNQYEKSFDNIKFDTSKKPTKEFIYSLVLKSRKKEKDVNN